jgi:hypothetical protein
VGEAFLRGVLDPADPAQLSGVLPRIREWDGWCGLDRNGDNWSITDGRYLATKFDAGARINIAASVGLLKVDLIDSGFSFSLDLANKNVLPATTGLPGAHSAPAQPTDKACAWLADADRRRASLLHPRHLCGRRQCHHFQAPISARPAPAAASVAHLPRCVRYQIRHRLSERRLQRQP